MNVFAPVSSIMTERLITVSPLDEMTTVKAAFDQKKIHHLPVVEVGKIVGLISRHDFDLFMGSMAPKRDDQPLNENRLHRFHAKDIMTRGLGKLEPDDRIRVAIDIFLMNRFHALPVVDANGELVGIVTPFDILRALDAEKPAHPEDVYDDLNK